MKECSNCGQSEGMPYECNGCGNYFCSEHRLPEKHDCTHDPLPPRFSRIYEQAMDEDEQPGSLRGKVRTVLPTAQGTATYAFLLIIGAVYILQLLTATIGGRALHKMLFVLDGSHLEYTWTILTSIFSHSLSFPLHLIGNALALYFFGPIVERKIGTRRFIAVFLVAGILAGVGQIGLSYVLYEEPASVLGASGAILAILAILTVFRPNETVLAFFVVPLQLWVLTAGFLMLSTVGVLVDGTGGIAHGAHLVGLVIGLLYGKYFERKKENKIFKV